MKRKISDEHVAIIKQMLSRNYKTSSIKEFMQNKHGVYISAPQIYGIKKLTSYIDVRPNLNDAISKAYSSRITNDIERITDTKWALANGYLEEEIMNLYNWEKRELMAIRMGQNPYYSIAPEYNYQIKKRWGRKKNANIDKKMVIAIKKEYVDRNGEVLLNEIAEKHKIDKATVSTILTLKFYKEFGVAYNSKIKLITQMKEDKKKEKKNERCKVKIANEKLKHDALMRKKKQIENQLRESNANLKRLTVLIP
ncbi:hypothetical protein [Mangrovibacterium lignilyticum]|uniref:hypothetical protein n=1 Tax=Mangrovibacterium lignilyticum TaxID=2668052 RepID=UPI0013D74DF6|nr:hypothetical protein [Mangrovibacterium lignilyticum]